MPDAVQVAPSEDRFVSRLGVVLEQDTALAADGTCLVRRRVRDLLSDALLEIAVTAVVAAPHRGHVSDNVAAETEALPPGAEFFELGDRDRPAWQLTVIPRLWKLTGETDAGYVIFPSWRSIVAAWSYSLRRKPFVVAAVGPPVDGGVLEGVRWRAMASAARRASFVFAAGPRLEDFFRDHGAVAYQSGPMLVLRPSDLGAPRQGGIHDPIRCIYVGSLYPSKRVEDLIEAIAVLDEEFHLSAELRCVGDGDSSELRRLAEQLGVSDRVVFAGHVPPGPQLGREYDEADVLVFASVAEGFPRVLYEAAFAGLPIVTTAAGSIADVLTDEADCLIVGFRDPPAIARALQRLATDRSLRERIGRGQHAFALATLEDPYPASLIGLLQAMLRPATHSTSDRP